VMHTNLYDEPRISLLNSTRVAPYGRTDVRVTYTIDKRFEAYGEVINLRPGELRGVGGGRDGPQPDARHLSNRAGVSPPRDVRSALQVLTNHGPGRSGDPAWRL
jgi:hypothetical protein